MVEIISANIDHGVGLEKRFCMTGVVLQSTCPTCGEKVICKFDDDNHLSYPNVGINDIPFYHSYEGDDEGKWWHHEWAETIVINVTVSHPTADNVEHSTLC
jgi:hypothetical protein